MQTQGSPAIPWEKVSGGPMFRTSVDILAQLGFQGCSLHHCLDIAT